MTTVWHTLIALVLNIYQNKSNKKFIGDKYTTTNIFRTQAYDSILCGHVYIISINLIWKFYTKLMLITSYGKERQNNSDFFSK